jgi:hypothetical protein
MTANHGGQMEPSNRILTQVAAMCGFALFASMCAAVAFAAPPYDITVTFTPPITGGAPDGYNFYVGDCLATGPTAAPVGTVTSNQTFTGLITADGTYQMCVRAFNAAGENPDPGPVATVTIADIPLPGTVQNLNVTVDCPNSGCSVTVTIQ